MKSKNHKDKIQITHEEYLKIIERLNDIKKEEENLQKLKEYGWDFSNSFENFILYLKRINESIHLEILRSKKQFLQELNLNNNIYHKIDMKLNLFIEQTILEYQNNSPNIQPDMELLAVFSHYPPFSAFSCKIHDLVSKQQANQYLLEYMLNIMNEKNKLIDQKKYFEKNSKKKEKNILKKKNFN